MITIVDVLAVPGTGAYYFEDLTALQDAPLSTDARYLTAGSTAGFGAVREVAEAVSVGLALSDGRVAWGDCVSVAYGGKAGRAPAFRAAAGCATLTQVVKPVLICRPVASFREAVALLDGLTEQVAVERPREPEDTSRALSRRAFLTAAFRGARRETAAPPERTLAPQPLHPAIHYGASQALLAAAALAESVTPAEIIAAEWGLPRPDTAVPIHGQCGGDRYGGADKLIVRQAASLPHALVDDIPAQLGPEGDELVRYVRWLTGRIRSLGGADYRPTIHLDVHGGLGQLFGSNLGRILGVLHGLETAAQPYPIRIESPVIAGSRAEQIAEFKRLRSYLRLSKKQIQLVADEWANTLDDIRAFLAAGAADMIQIKMPDLGGIQNTIEAVLACQAAGVAAFLGGSCAETDLSARTAVHVALATRPAILMARPGLGVDEALAITGNEMARTLAWIGQRSGQ